MVEKRLPLYFAYGSNLSWEQMLTRCPSAKYLFNAVLPDHKLMFTRRSVNRKCGVADAAPSPGCKVWGVVYEINENDCSILDEIEGFNRIGKKNSYERKPVEVIRQNDSMEKSISVETYFAVRQINPPLPSKEYIELIITGAKHWGLPKEYIEKLEKIKTLSNYV